MLNKVHMHFHIAGLKEFPIITQSSVRGQFVDLMSDFPFGKMDGINY